MSTFFLTLSGELKKTVCSAPCFRKLLLFWTMRNSVWQYLFLCLRLLERLVKITLRFVRLFKIGWFEIGNMIVNLSKHLLFYSHWRFSFVSSAFKLQQYIFKLLIYTCNSSRFRSYFLLTILSMSSKNLFQFFILCSWCLPLHGKTDIRDVSMKSSGSW